MLNWFGRIETRLQHKINFGGVISVGWMAVEGSRASRVAAALWPLREK
jgi:hypothetical protein